MYVLPLHISLETATVGGKAYSLSRLINFGVNVPNGCVISKDVLNHYVKKQTLPEGFSKELETSITSLKSNQLIVRSSAIGEDSDSHSFAGQLDSFVVENNLELVQNAIYKCWNGLSNERVLAYQKISGMKLTEMGVVIQEFLKADYAGVTFTQSPYDELASYTEYVKGAGEQLVSGKVTPKNFSVTENQVAKQMPFNAKLLTSNLLS